MYFVDAAIFRNSISQQFFDLIGYLDVSLLRNLTLIQV